MKTRQSIIFVVLIAVSVFIVMQYAYGQQLNNTNSADIVNSKLNVEIVKEQLNALEEVRNYCFQHASDPNPIQDLIDKGFLPESFTGENCKSVKVMIEKLRDIAEKQRTPYEAYLIEQAMNNTKFNNCLSQKMSVVFCYDTYIGNRPRQ